MKYFAILVALTAFMCPAANAYTVTTYTPQNSSEPTIGYCPSGYNSYPKVSQIESILLNRTYENESIDSRLGRLEQRKFKRTYPSSDLSWRVDNLFANVDQAALYGISAKELSGIEKKVLGRTFGNDNLENRIGRVEQQVFGAMQGGKVDERFATIRTAANNYSNFTDGVGQPVSSNFGTGGGFKNTLSNIFGGMFNSGYMTGYTPQISPYGYSSPYGFNTYGNGSYSPYSNYNNYNNYGNYGNYGHGSPYSAYSGANNPYGYGNSGSGIRRSVRTRTGYYDSNRNAGSGCGVHILD